MTEEELSEVQWAWKLYKTTEQLQQMLLLKYHQAFIFKREKEDRQRELDKQLPF